MLTDEQRTFYQNVLELWTPETYCTGVYAQKADGSDAEMPNDPEAVRWCIFGMMYRLHPEVWRGSPNTLLNNHLLTPVSKEFGTSVIQINDQENGHTLITQRIRELLAADAAEREATDGRKA